MIAYGTGHRSGTVGRHRQAFDRQGNVVDKATTDNGLPEPVHGCEVPDELIPARVAKLVGGRKPAAGRSKGK